ncbi:hypothetical protein FQN57_003586 [Myotisia sp. PD_48]|nr:hypothetical protein FQN57_003586 [Myotisia sp. PD_48]
MCGQDPDYSKRDLWAAIERGKEIDVAQKAVPDAGVWPPGAEQEPRKLPQGCRAGCFSPGSMVPGIKGSPDPLLQFRMFFYRDAQYHRIGVNLHQIPVNCPFMTKSYTSLNFDGAMRVDANYAGNKNTCINTAKWLDRVNYTEIQVKYLAQLYNIAPGYAQGVFDLLLDPAFDFSDVTERAKTAHEWYKEPKFRPAMEGTAS